MFIQERKKKEHFFLRNPNCLHVTCNIKMIFSCLKNNFLVGARKQKDCPCTFAMHFELTSVTVKQEHPCCKPN